MNFVFNSALSEMFQIKIHILSHKFLTMHDKKIAKSKKFLFTRILTYCLIISWMMSASMALLTLIAKKAILYKFFVTVCSISFYCVLEDGMISTVVQASGRM
jgi:hypothetical protein